MKTVSMSDPRQPSPSTAPIDAAKRENSFHETARHCVRPKARWGAAERAAAALNVSHSSGQCARSVAPTSETLLRPSGAAWAVEAEAVGPPATAVAEARVAPPVMRPMRTRKKSASNERRPASAGCPRRPAKTLSSKRQRSRRTRRFCKTGVKIHGGHRDSGATPHAPQGGQAR